MLSCWEPSRFRRAMAVAVPSAVMSVLGLWGLDRGGMWRDEAVTFQVARRSVPQIWRLLHTVDAVHGLYYLLMHAVLAVRADEVLLRLPSVCAAALTTGLVAALGTRLARPRVGLWAGLLYAVTPMTGHYAQEGRSYALVAAGATGATLLLVRAVAGGGRSWWAYGAVVGVTCWLHEFAVLLLLAHAVTLALTRMPWTVWRGWAAVAGAVVVALVPVVLVSRAQSAQLAWLREPGTHSAEWLAREFLGQSGGVYRTCLALAVLGASGTLGRRGEPTGGAVALPLLLVPPAALMAASLFTPLYVDRYVLYALAGAPLLAALGAEQLVRAAGEWLCHALPRPRSPLVTATGALAVVLALVLQLPVLRADRHADTRPDNLAALAAIAARELRPGDPVLFLPAQARSTALAYPAGFRGTRDVALARPAAESGTLYGREVGERTLRSRLAGLGRVWVIAERRVLDARRYPRDPTERAKLSVVEEEFVLREESVRDAVALRLYVRRPFSPGRTPVPPAVPRRPATW
jgi:mannosyltransferase